MYVLSINTEVNIKDALSFPELTEICKQQEDDNELFYWRKHPDLHIWFRDLFYQKGGYRDSEFNGDGVRITSEDLDQLEELIKDDGLSTTRSKIWGESYYGSATEENDLTFIKKAREALADDKIIYYTSSW